MRKQIVDEALSWIDTPYILGQCLKGVGCDCATLIYGVLFACGLIDRETIPHFGPDWFAHTDKEFYKWGLLRHAYKTAEGISYATLEALPGSIVLTRHSESSRVYNHGGIVVAWPQLIHAIGPKVEQIDATAHWMWSYRKVAVFDPVAKLELEHIS